MGTFPDSKMRVCHHLFLPQIFFLLPSVVANNLHRRFVCCNSNDHLLPATDAPTNGAHFNPTIQEPNQCRIFVARRIEVRAPSRIDLAGGWTDVPTYCKHKSGVVVNIAINQYVNCEMVIDDERKISVSYSTDMPTGSGLGTSGAMNVGFISTITNATAKPLDNAEVAYQFEALLGNKGGRQDQWASALGGINHLTFTNDSVDVEELTPSSQFVELLESRLLLFNSHIAHVSGDLHKSVWHRFENGDKEIIRGLDMIRDAGQLMAKALVSESIEDVTAAMNMNSAGVDILGLELHEPFRDIMNQLHDEGLIAAWKAMGAGGGGVVGVIAASQPSIKTIVDVAENTGWSHLPWKVDYEGVIRSETNL